MKAKRLDRTAFLKSGQGETQRFSHGLADLVHMLLLSDSRFVVYSRIGRYLFHGGNDEQWDDNGTLRMHAMAQGVIFRLSFSGLAGGLGPHRGLDMFEGLGHVRPAVGMEEGRIFFGLYFVKDLQLGSCIGGER